MSVQVLCHELAVPPVQSYFTVSLSMQCSVIADSTIAILKNISQLKTMILTWKFWAAT